MKKVLLVDDDHVIHELINSTLSKYSSIFELVHAFDIKNAAAALERDDDIALIVTDIVMPGGDGFQLLAHIYEKHPEIPCIVITSYELPELQERLSGKVFQMFKKPVMSQELADAILRGLKTQQKKSDLGEFSVVGIVQLMETEGTTCRLDVHKSSDHHDMNQCIEQNCKEFRGSLFLVQGTIYDAICGKLVGEEAALKLLSMEGVQVSSCLLDKNIIRRVHKSNQNLLINAMIQKDHQCGEEEDGGEEPQQQKLLDEGIRLCERLEFVQAQKPLMAFVKENRKNALGWLWLSRAVTEPKKIKTALAEAYRLEPEHADILEDVEKARLLNSAAAEAKIIRCPFCYAPLEHQAPACICCKASLLTESSALAKIDPYAVDRRLILQAAGRFEKVLAAEVNPKILFYAGAAYLNLNDFDKALTYFDLLMPIIQVDSRYQKVSEQVGQIVDYIASNQKIEERSTPTSSAQQFKKERQVIDNQTDKKTVLVVEDSPTTRKVIKMTLQSGGFRVIEAVDGVEALSKLNDDRPDMVLLDIMLPKIDGYKLLSILKKNGETKDIPVVMLTSKNRILDKVKGHLSAASAYLTKPFKPAELINVVNSILDKNAPEGAKSTETSVS
ncbi:MAG: twitching motility two-component system response regulator PilG [Candidatus Electronema aureum]|uniref:Twitching motility two-component system response regulator PilG n=1 Tax=Candidatus Electronema aureum TaxID=2005002 RepID=A0A521G3W2_9BACT|nr:MAG: twitching motility two-component system response regulator PilG [Candidatus Electronema aureum]